MTKGYFECIDGIICRGTEAEPEIPMSAEWCRFHFDYQDGLLIRLRAKQRPAIGRVVGAEDGGGYLLVSVKCVVYAVHRIIWAWHGNKFTKSDIDHEDGVRTNNKIGNLREATRQENTRNAKGTVGVCWDTHNGKWEAYITVDGKHINLGRFEREAKADALAARKKAEQKYFGVFSK